MEAGLRIFSRPRLARLTKAIGQCAAGRKSHAIEAIPDLLEMPAINGAIVSIDAIGTRKAIAAKIVAQEAGCVLALKGNRSAPRDDVKRFLEDAELAKTCAVHKTTGAGHGRIEEPECRAADAIEEPEERHPDRPGLRGIAAITAKRGAKKRGRASVETRFHMTSLPAGPAAILSCRACAWGIANNLVKVGI